MKGLINLSIKCFLLIWFWMLIIGMPTLIAADWRADWIDNTEVDLAGYFLYWRTPAGVYNETNRSWTVVSEKLLTGLVPDNNYICVTAHDELVNESECSEEILFNHNLPPVSVPTGVTIVEIIP